jgi:5-deoxy-glucuronate isomerase
VDWTSLRVLEDSGEISTGDWEMLLLPLAGSCSVTCGPETFELQGRVDVFAGPTDFAYLPARSTARIDGQGRFALPGARTARELPFRYGTVSDVAIERRGAGNCSRLIRNFCMAATFEADKLLACEVITPSGNWSSYPPHKHDQDRPGEESVLEEIYYFEVDQAGIGYMRVYSSDDRPVDVLAEVRTGDVVDVPYGWHGPAMAVPGYDLYYLNVMAGPGARDWQICDDPAHAWIRQTWETQAIDPRLVT